MTDHADVPKAARSIEMAIVIGTIVPAGVPIAATEHLTRETIEHVTETTVSIRIHPVGAEDETLDSQVVSQNRPGVSMEREQDVAGFEP